MRKNSNKNKKNLKPVIEYFEEFEKSYWNAIYKLIAKIGFGTLPSWIEMVREIEITECEDGVVVLRYPSRNSFNIKHIKKRNQKASDYFKRKSSFNDPFGRGYPGGSSLSVDKMTSGFLFFGQIYLPTPETFYTSDFLSAIYCVSIPDKQNPTEKAKKQAEEDVKQLIFLRNLGIVIGKDQIPSQNQEQEKKKSDEAVIQKLIDIEKEYQQALDNAKKEEDIQRFLSSNTFLLSPNGIVTPKVRLGSQFITDFVIEDPFGADHSHVFVEIEDPKELIFKSSEKERTEPRQRFNHALNQIRDWRRWLSDNANTFRNEHFSSYQQPKFMLLYGRSKELDKDDRKRALLEISRETNALDIYTFDDLLKRLIDIRVQLEKISTSQK